VPRPKESEKFRIQEFANRSGTTSWRVCGTRPDGSRFRQNFAVKSEAFLTLSKEEEAAAGVTDTRRMHRTSLTAEQLADAEAATCSARGQQLSRAVSRLLDLQSRAEAKGVSLDHAMAFFESRYRPEGAAISIMNARDEFIASRVGLAGRTLRGYKNSTALLLKSGPNKPLHNFSVGDLEFILKRYRNLNSRKTHQRIFAVFFNWAVRHHYCLENPCARLDKIPLPSTHITILALDEVKRLLLAAVNYRDGLTAPTLAIALLAGLRPSELADLKPEDIKDERIRVRGGKLRRTLNRTVPVPPNLAAWLKKYPFKGQPKAWDHKIKVLKAAVKARKWVQDILRHTSISYQAQRDKNDALTAFNNGTSKQMMDRHYRDVIDCQKELKEYWSLTPATLPKGIKVTLPCQPDVEWPSKAKLAKLVWEKPLMHLAKDIGVSDVALKKHCVKAGIELPERGYWVRDEMRGR